MIPGPNNILLPSEEYYFRATLDHDGVFAFYYHPTKIENDSEWVYVGSLPDHNICLDIYGDTGSGACGYNNVCNLVNWRPVCRWSTRITNMEIAGPFAGPFVLKEARVIMSWLPNR
ncbi:kinase-like protein [Striga asiatica]|uniref:Kinase-like protein n=1 Tax=Striga asiatica TaxID=4170 RepID=A0A5A7NWZ6_STRAF|nr:kinase-like protein [Striga asiatica]